MGRQAVQEGPYKYKIMRGTLRLKVKYLPGGSRLRDSERTVSILVDSTSTAVGTHVYDSETEYVGERL